MGLCRSTGAGGSSKLRCQALLLSLPNGLSRSKVRLSRSSSVLAVSAVE